MASHGRTHSEWYLCEHDSDITISRCSWTSSRHTAHTSTFDIVLVSSTRRRPPPVDATEAAVRVGVADGIPR
jgi:hypothetical protein